MFWVWFIIVGILGGWLAGKTTIPRLRRATPTEVLKTIAWGGLGALVLFGIFGIGRGVDSWFFHCMVATLSWAGIVSVPELFRRGVTKNKIEYQRDLEKEITQSKKIVPKIRKPNQNFMDKTSFEFPLAPPEPLSPAKEDLADLLAKSVEKHRQVEAPVEALPVRTANLGRLRSQARGKLLSLLQAFNDQDTRIVEPEFGGQKSLDVLAPAPPSPSLFSTPILDVGTTQQTQGITSRFGSSSVRTLGEPLRAADLESEPADEHVDQGGGFTYQPKLIESKFSTPIE